MTFDLRLDTVRERELALAAEQGMAHPPADQIFDVRAVRTLLVVEPGHESLQRVVQRQERDTQFGLMPLDLPRHPQCAAFAAYLSGIVRNQAGRPGEQVEVADPAGQIGGAFVGRRRDVRALSFAGGGEELNLVADAGLLAGASLTSTLEAACSGVVEMIADVYAALGLGSEDEPVASPN